MAVEGIMLGSGLQKLKSMDLLFHAFSRNCWNNVLRNNNKHHLDAMVQSHITKVV